MTFKLSTLEKCQDKLRSTVFQNYKDQVSIELGLKCLVVCVHQNSWEGPTPSFIDDIPITYVFDVPRRYNPFTR